MKSARTRPNITRSIYHVLRRFGSTVEFNTYIPSGYEEPIQQCLNAQSHLGWTGFLEGLLTTDWAALQQQYYESQESRKTGRGWAIGLSTQVWRMVFAMWQHRNNCLHTSETLARLSGIEQVDIVIKDERALGISTLDPIYAPYFQQPTANLLKLSSTKRRKWLALIRHARESTGHTYTDEIATQDSLHRWIGLRVQRSPGSEITTRHYNFSRTGYCD